MLFTTILLAISSSIDSLGIGITYGIRNTIILNKGKLVIFFISFIITLLSSYLGNILKLIFPTFFIDYFASLLFIVIGIFICFQALKNEKKSGNKKIKNCNYQKTYSFFIKFLGVSIKVIKDPVSLDLDNSNKIDNKEALFLSLALSIDSLCIGGSSRRYTIHPQSRNTRYHSNFYSLIFQSLRSFVVSLKNPSNS